MTTAPERHTNNILIGAGELYLDLFDDDGDATGERYLGDAVGGTLSVTTEETTVFSGTGPVAEELTRVTRSVTRSFGLTLHDMSLENQALFVIGDAVADAIDATAVTDEEFPVRPLRWYQLGTTAARPAGVNKVTAVTVGGGTITAGVYAAVAWMADVDYRVDADSGRIYIEDTALTRPVLAGVQVDYTPVAQDREQVRSATKQLKGAFRYIEDPAEGEGRNFYAPDCTITPGGDLGLLDGRNTEQQIALTVAALEPGGALRALYIDGQPQ